MDTTKSRSEFKVWWNAPEQEQLREICATNECGVYDSLYWSWLGWEAGRKESEVKSPEIIPEGWVSCNDRMPCKGAKVLVVIDFKSEMVGRLIKDAEYTGSTFRIGPNTVSEKCETPVTHWMALPAAPAMLSSEYK